MSKVLFSRWLTRSALAALTTVLVAACAHNPALEEGKKLIADGQRDAGVLRMETAMRNVPDDMEARSQYYRQREITINGKLVQAEQARANGKLDEAESIYHEILQLNADNTQAKDGLALIAKARKHLAWLREAEQALAKGDRATAERKLRTVLTENPAQREAQLQLKKLQDEQAESATGKGNLANPFAKPVSLEFRDTPIKSAFEVMSRVANLNFVLDKDVKADTKITLFIRNATLEEALRLILATNQLEYKLLNANSVLIYPNTANKNKEYQELVVKSFYLANSDVRQAQNLIKNMVKTRDVFVDEKLNLLVIRDTPDAIRLAEKLLETLDLASPEVMLDVEVLEISRNRLLNLGLDWPTSVGYGRLTPDTSTVTSSNGSVVNSGTAFGGTLTPGNIDLRHRSGLTAFVANPAATLNLKKQDGDSKILANPRIRVVNREKAKIHIGDKLPVFTTTSTANVGVSASVSYLDVGLKLEVEPTVHLDENVEMKVSLEVSSIVKEVSGPSNSLAYQIGSRSANTVLRLRDGETQVLAGLINDEERTSATRVPGLGDIPVVGRLFGSQNDTSNKTEIVLLITPHVLRRVVPPEVSMPTLYSGTENAVGARPLTVQSGSLKGISRTRAGLNKDSGDDAEQGEAGAAEKAAGNTAENAANNDVKNATDVGAINGATSGPTGSAPSSAAGNAPGTAGIPGKAEVNDAATAAP